MASSVTMVALLTLSFELPIEQIFSDDPAPE
jgi:hypothetical protein